MAFKIHWLRQASKDIDAIFQFIVSMLANKWHSVELVRLFVVLIVLKKCPI